MRVRWRAAAVAAIALAAGCSGAEAERRRPAEPELQIWTPAVVRWEPGAARHVDFAIENPTSRTVAVAAPDPANARVEVYAGPDRYRVCGVAPFGAGSGERIALAPGDGVSVRVDLGTACGAVPPGDYRYVVSYDAPDPGGEGAFSGTLPARYGEVIVSAPPQAACSPEAQPRAPRARARHLPAARGAARRDPSRPAEAARSPAEDRR